MSYDLIPAWAVQTYNQNVLHQLQQGEIRLQGQSSMKAGLLGKKKRFQYIGAFEMTDYKGHLTDTDIIDDNFYNRWRLGNHKLTASVVDLEDVIQLLTDTTSYIVEKAVKAENH